MVWVDYAILVIIGVSALISVLRGFVKEALSLLGWVAAAWIAITFTPQVAVALESHVNVPSVRHGLAFFGLFAVTLLVVAVVIYIVGLVVEKTGISGTDRMLGVVFGVARGAVIVALLVMLAGLTPVSQDSWWQDSVFIPHFDRLVAELRSLLPPDIAAYFNS